MRKFVLVFLLAASCLTFGQDAPKAPPPPPPKTEKPMMAQLRETVIVIKLECQSGEKLYHASGTGFFVQVSDEKQRGMFTSYLVTNRHVAECWDHRQHPMEVKSVGIRVNLLDGSSTTTALNEKGNVPWVLPSSDSVDLAVLPLGLKRDKVEWRAIPTAAFATDDLFSSGLIHEGQSIVFTGFFPKIEGVKKAQPIAREGIISSLADEPLIELKKDVPAKFYLGDVHVVAGNSGSPVLVNIGGVQGNSIMGESYRLLGVVSGYLTEDEDMSLKLETTIEATASANSGIATIIPVAALRDLLNDGRLVKQRDAEVSKLLGAKAK